MHVQDTVTHVQDTMQGSSWYRINTQTIILPPDAQELLEMEDIAQLCIHV